MSSNAMFWMSAAIIPHCRNKLAHVKPFDNISHGGPNPTQSITNRLGLTKSKACLAGEFLVFSLFSQR